MSFHFNLRVRYVKTSKGAPDVRGGVDYSDMVISALCLLISTHYLILLML